MYATATYVITRNRPAVPRLEHLIVADSFPSGHTAASVALDGSLAIIVWTETRSRWWRGITIVLSVAAPIIVATSRLTAACTTRPTSSVVRPIGVGCVAVGYRRSHGPRRCTSDEWRRPERRTASTDPESTELWDDVGRRGRALGEDARRRADRAALACWPRQGVDDPLWFEVPKIEDGAEARAQGARRRAPTSSSCGAATAWCSAASTPWPAPTSRSRSCPAGTAQPVRVEPRDTRRTSQPRSRSACTAARHASTSGAINGEHFAVMAGRRPRRADDPRRRRAVEGPVRPAPPTSGPARRTSRSQRVRRSRRGRRRSSGSTARRAACSSATSARSWATSPPSPTRAPTTGCSRSASSPPKGAGSGRERLARTAAGERRTRRRSSRRTRGREVRRPLREDDPVRARRRRPEEDHDGCKIKV